MKRSDVLASVDTGSRRLRALFPVPEREFVAGLGLLTPVPTKVTLRFVRATQSEAPYLLWQDQWSPTQPAA